MALYGDMKCIKENEQSTCFNSKIIYNIELEQSVQRYMRHTHEKINILSYVSWAC
jgi:hypothetical protein